MSEPVFTPSSGSPGLTTRPPIVAAPPPPPRRRSAVWKVLWFILLLVLCASVITNFVLLALLDFTGTEEGPSGNVAEETIVSGGSDRIAVLPIDGEIDEAMADRVRKFAEAIADDSSIKAVIMEVDSPGGSVTASDEIYHTLTDLSHDHNLTIWVSMGSLAASGGYYVSMAGEKIYAEPTTLTGSIGVIWPAFEISDLLQKVGVTPEIITSTPAVWKDAGSPFAKFTEKDIDYIRGLVNNAHERFSDIVATGRGKKLKLPMTDIAIGKIWPATEARDKYGLVDEIGYLNDVYTQLAAAKGIKNPTVVRLKERRSLLETLGASTNMGGGKVQIDARTLFDLQNPKMEYRYIAPTFGMKE